MELAWGPIASAGIDPGVIGWQGGRCSATYCHGNFRLGNPANAPSWTAPVAVACGTCHGIPPGGTHPASTACASCHTGYSSTVVNRDTHVNGVLDVTGGGHAASWMDASSPDFHAFSADRGLAACQGCHGAALDGGFTGVGCARCHDAALPAGVTTWSQNCVMCHGGGSDGTGAPPRTIWGYQSDAVRVGAHAAHLAGGALAGPIACSTCHVRPSSAFSDGHIDLVAGAAAPTASVTFSGVAAVGGAGTWDRASRGCTVYCHGAGFAGTPAQGSNSVPDWTGGAGEATCGSCHALPPGGTHPANPLCGSCHAGYGATTVNLGTHLNGVVDAPVLGCASCHGDASRPATALNPQLPAAPPLGTHGETAPTERAVGAHQLHLTAGALSNGIACGECHAPVTSGGVGGGHRNGTVELAWGPIASAGIDAAVITWQDGRCSGTYCHGNFRLGNPLNAPTWTAPSAGACGSCHGLPPGGSHPASSACGSCHAGYDATSVNRDTHVNGVLDVTGGGGHAASWMDASSPEFHAFSADRGLSACQGCHGATLEGGFTGVACASCHDRQLPAGVTSWIRNCVMCHGGGNDGTGAPPRTIWGQQADTVRVGAHAAHLAGGPLARPIACATCHVPPADAFAAGHIDLVAGSAVPTASVVFSGVAAVGGAGSWDRAARGCTVYCHGAAYVGTPAQGSHSTPDWTGGAGEATCGSCHALPPGGSHPANPQCGSCHVGYGAASVNLDTHLNGVVEAPALGCTSCHGDASRPATALNPQLPVAPPYGTHGETAPTERAVGAHQLHLTAGPLSNGVSCQECHAPVTSSRRRERPPERSRGPGVGAHRVRGDRRRRHRVAGRNVLGDLLPRELPARLSPQRAELDRPRRGLVRHVPRPPARRRPPGERRVRELSPRLRALGRQPRHARERAARRPDDVHVVPRRRHAPAGRPGVRVGRDLHGPERPGRPADHRERSARRRPRRSREPVHRPRGAGALRGVPPGRGPAGLGVAPERPRRRALRGQGDLGRRRAVVRPRGGLRGDVLPRELRGDLRVLGVGLGRRRGGDRHGLLRRSDGDAIVDGWADDVRLVPRRSARQRGLARSSRKPAAAPRVPALPPRCDERERGPDRDHEPRPARERGRGRDPALGLRVLRLPLKRAWSVLAGWRRDAGDAPDHRLTARCA